MTTLTKIILGLVAVIVVGALISVGLSGWQGNKDAQIQALRQQLGAAQAETAQAHQQAQEAAAKGQEWKATADAAVARMSALEGRLKGVEAKLAALAPQPPHVDTTTLPGAPTAIAQAMTDQGVKAKAIIPAVAGVDVGLAAPDAQQALGLIIDGKNYPAALARVELLQENVDLLGQQKTDLNTALEARDAEATAAQDAYSHEVEARESAEKATALTEKIVTEKDAMLKAERPKKYIWAGSAAAIVALVFLL